MNMTTIVLQSHLLHCQLLFMAANHFSSVNTLVMPAVFLALSLLIHGASSDTSRDITECGSQLIGMQTCITYVQGTAKAPTPDCCTGLREVLAKSPKCLCILVKDHDDPQLPVKINVTRALALPTACRDPANISACSQILDLPPNSKDAEIFKQSGGSAAEAKGSSTENNATGTSPQPKPETSSGRSNYLGWRTRETVAAACVLFLIVMPLLLST